MNRKYIFFDSIKSTELYQTKMEEIVGSTLTRWDEERNSSKLAFEIAFFGQARERDQ